MNTEEHTGYCTLHGNGLCVCWYTLKPCNAVIGDVQDQFWGLDADRLSLLMAVWKHWKPDYATRYLN
jgi:hypothetical protein